MIYIGLTELDQIDAYGGMEMELFEGSPAQSDPIHYKCHVELNSELSMSSRRLKSRALERPVSNPRT